MECKHTELTEQKLNNILESHKKLWAFRVFINPQIRDKDSSIKKYFNNELCFFSRKKLEKEKSFLNEWLDYELKNKYKVNSISVSEYDKLKNEVTDQVLIETYGPRSATNLRKTINEVCKTNGITKK